MSKKENIQKYPFKEGLLLEFEIVDLSDILSRKREMMTTPHRAQFYHILWIEKGRGTHYIDFKPIEIKDHSIIFMPQNCVNVFDKKGEYDGKALIFTDGFFCKNEQDVSFLNASILFSDFYDRVPLQISPKSSDLHQILKSMETEFQRASDPSQYHILHHMLHIFLLQAEREMRKQGFQELQPSQNRDDLMAFKDLLEQGFYKEKSVKKYASALGLSEKQLNKVCTQLVDQTPKQIIDGRVMLEAKRLLVHTTLAVKEIAYQLGYEEPTNFIKYFKKHSLTTPADFRLLNP